MLRHHCSAIITHTLEITEVRAFSSVMINYPLFYQVSFIITKLALRLDKNKGLTEKRESQKRNLPTLSNIQFMGGAGLIARKLKSRGFESCRYWLFLQLPIILT